MRYLFENIRLAWGSLTASKLRSGLTVLCIVISIMSIIAVVSIVQGMDVFVKTKIADRGSNVFTVEKRDPILVFTDFEAFLESLKHPNITLDDLEMLRRDVPLAQFIDAAANTSERLSHGSIKMDNITIRGRTDEYPAIGEFPLAFGRHLTRADLMQRRHNCVIGFDVAETLFPDELALGKTIKIGGKHFTIIGVVEEKGQLLGSNQNLFAFIPITTFLKNYGSRRSLEIQIRTGDMAHFEAAQEQANIAMRVARRLKPHEKNNFFINTSEQLLSIWKAISTGIFGALIGVVSITLIVGGIIIMNVMLVAVTERTREIGVRKSVGAKRSDIIFQFLVEAVILSLFGGVIGVLLGFTAASIVAMMTPMPYTISVVPIALALFITFTIGIFFGVYPARKASRLDPVEALRH